jgi:hypothetical protein
MEDRMSDSTVETVPLGFGFTLECSFQNDMDTVSVDLNLHGRKLRTMVFCAHSPEARHTLNLGLVRFETGFDADMFAGELTWSLKIGMRQRSGSWRTLHEHIRLAFRFDPSLGDVAKSAAPYPPTVDDPRFGKSQPCTPTILRFHVEEEKRKLCPIGSIVKREMFPDYPPFVFNTVACVGAFPENGPGLYTDPDSIWFNTFLGYYQLDCAKECWPRPFGYDTANGTSSVPVPEDLVRLGKSDWNWFSNWNYGVPKDVLLPYSSVPSPIDSSCTLESVGAKQWHKVTVKGTEVASCYVADPPARALVENSIVEFLWRRSFGGPNPRPAHTTSFIPTVVDATVYMAYWEDDDSYHTVIFGGTILEGKDVRFLETQLQVVEAVMKAHYPGLGF